MVRDFKPRAKRDPPKKRPADGAKRQLLLGFFLGLAPGLLVAFLVYLSFSPSPVRKPVESPRTTSQEAAPATKTKPAEPEPTDVKPPRFEFYTILPGREVMVPEQQTDRQEVSTSIPTPTQTVKKEGEYLLQAGSFRDYADADRLKARIALLGMVASIQTVVIKQGEQWHRVRIGPVDSSAELKRIQTRLAENKIEGLVIRQAPQNY